MSTPRTVTDLDGDLFAVEITTVPPSPLEVQRCLHAALVATVPKRKATPATAERAAMKYTVELRRIDDSWNLIVPRSLLVEAL
jgi:hypothetical protein